MVFASHPLISRRLADPFLFLGAPDDRSGIISAGQFLAQASALADALPDGRFAINLCGSRYRFMLAFCAVILRGQTNLLPPNRNTATQALLRERYTRCYVIHDGVEVAADLDEYKVGKIAPSGDGRISDIPEVALDHLSAITFTSGSTGESKPNPKPWRTFVESSKINMRYMVPPGGETITQLATVPGQHMWGLETSVLLPMFANICIADGRPLFPLDIQAALAALDAPRMLVSTPVHLRALALSGLKFPPVQRVLSATAPLDKALARATEKLLQAELCEIYDCSEVGSMAYRYTAREDDWTLFDGLDLEQNSQGTQASAPHLPESVQLQDIVEKTSDRRFQLKGRSSDMIEIAGKRGSLQEVNKILLSTPGVQDGVVFYPETKASVGRLVAIVVLADGVSREDIISRFRAHLDAAFVPRPIYVVDALPREENGKLPGKRVIELYNSLKEKSPIV